MDIEELALKFKTFAIRECRGSSYLYEALSTNIAEDDGLLELASNARDGQPIPNLLLGSVHYLLLNGRQHELSEYYLSMTSNPLNSKMAFPYFNDFCQSHKQEIISIIKNKLVQTNEVRRCAYLHPSFCYIYEKTQRPLALIEIGTSAGLQLLWDQYVYSYQSDDIYGKDRSEVHIQSEIRGDKTPNLLINSPPISSRIGLDLHVNDVTDHEDYLWLKSLIWPEHTERIALFNKAVQCLKKQSQSIQLIEGDGVAMLMSIASEIPEDAAICIFHTHVANQMSKDTKHTLLEHVQALGKARDVFHLYNNMYDLDLHLDYFVNGYEYNETLASTDGHGRWFEWKNGGT